MYTTRTARNCRLALGNVLISIPTQQEVEMEDINEALDRHALGEWGHVTGNDWNANKAALQCGGRIFSMHASRNGTEFCIVTEADRRLTRVFLRNEFS